MIAKELFRIVDGEQVYTFTSADSDEIYNGETYAKTAIGRTEIESKNELTKAGIDTSFSIENPLIRNWLKLPPENTVTLTIFRKDESGEVAVWWKGRMSSLKPDNGVAVVAWESVFTSLRRPGLRARYQRMCRHVLYGRGCRLDKAAFALAGVAMACNGLILVVPQAATKPDGWYVGGMVECGGMFRFIVAHTGATLTMMRDFAPLTQLIAEYGYGLKYGLRYGGIGVKLYPGCARNREDCSGKFNNLLNYGGFPFIPIRNPFDGSSIV